MDRFGPMGPQLATPSNALIHHGQVKSRSLLESELGVAILDRQVSVVGKMDGAYRGGRGVMNKSPT